MLSGLSSGHGLPNLQPQGSAHGRRHSITNLTVFIQKRPAELVHVWESLAASTLSDGNQPGFKSYRTDSKTSDDKVT